LVYSGVQSANRDDLFQEILISIHRSAHRYDAGRPVEPWVFTIVANAVRSHFRSLKRQRIVPGDARSDQSTCETGHDSSIAGETAGYLGQAIRDLPLEQREAVLLCCVRGLEQEEVARMLGRPLNTIKTHLRRGRLSLARSLSARNEVIEKEVSS
jgi:RNA polymerase sigma-70 factor (ECF subfamily)